MTLKEKCEEARDEISAVAGWMEHNTTLGVRDLEWIEAKVICTLMSIAVRLDEAVATYEAEEKIQF